MTRIFKKNLSKFFILTKDYLIFENRKSVSVISGPFLFTATKINLFSGFSPNYWFYDFDATKIFKKLKFLDIFVLLVAFGILSHYPNIDKSHWRREYVKRIMEKVFIEKLVD